MRVQTIHRVWGQGSTCLSDFIIRYSLLACALVSVLTTLGILFVLIEESLGFFLSVSLAEFLGTTEWYPLLEPRRYGIWPLITGTLMIAVGACVIAVPVGVSAALFLSEYANPKLRVFLKSCLEVLAGVPTVVYGFLALSFITPSLQNIFPSLEVFNALSASIVVGVMVIPTIASISQDAFESVPSSLREAGYGLGARRFQTAFFVVLPAAFSGVVASIILAFSRAIGETMAVTLAAGSTPKFGLNYFESVQTMTAYIVQVSKGDTPAGTIEYKTIFAVGLVLFLMTLFTNFIASRLVRRVAENYE